MTDTNTPASVLADELERLIERALAATTIGQEESRMESIGSCVRRNKDRILTALRNQPSVDDVIEQCAKVAESKRLFDAHGNLAWWYGDGNVACASIAQAIRALAPTTQGTDSGLSEELAAMRIQGQREGKAAVCAWLRHFTAIKPASEGAEKVAALADMFEQSERAYSALAEGAGK